MSTTIFPVQVATASAVIATPSTLVLRDTFGSVTGAAVAASGLNGAILASRHVGATVSGAPTTGTFVVGDYIVDQSGKTWYCVTGGTSGVWTTAGLWTTYTPTLTTGTTFTLGNGTLTGKYSQIGKTVNIHVFVSVGSTTAFGTGAITLGLPVASLASTEQELLAKTTVTSYFNFSGWAVLSGGLFMSPYFPGSVSNTGMSGAQNASAGNATGTGVPILPGGYTYGTAGTNIIIQGTYEAA